MKKLSVNLDGRQILPFKKAVRTKKDVITIWMHALKAFIIGGEFTAADARAGTLTIALSSMSRLFCESDIERKVFSVSFPFKLKEGEGGERFFCSRGNFILNSKTTSDILALINDGKALEISDFYGFMEAVDEAAADDQDIWGLLRDLMLSEDGYIRYDRDPERVDGDKHPEHHFDVCYSSEATYKVGLVDAVDQQVFIDVLDIGTDCHFLLPSPLVGKVRPR